LRKTAQGAFAWRVESRSGIVYYSIILAGCCVEERTSRRRR